MNRKRLKAFALSMGLGVAMLTVTPALAQMIGQPGEHPDGSSSGHSHKNGLMQRGGNRDGGSIFGNEAFGAAGSEIHNEPFGAPIGGGLVILLAAGAGYALIQSKKNKQN